MRLFKKTSPRRNQVRKNIATEHFLQISRLANTHSLVSILLLLLFVALCTSILSFEQIQEHNYRDLTSMIVIVALISVGLTFYIYHYQRRIIQNHVRAMVLAGMFCLLLAATKLGVALTKQNSWATGTAVTAAIILTIAYDQRFAIGMSIFYAALACFAVPQPQDDITLFFIMSVGIFSCCFSLTEIRTRMKLLEVSTLATVIVFITSISLDFMAKKPTANIFINGGWHAMATFLVGLFIQSLLPVIEKTFRIATSMTLLDFSDANQPLLKRLAMEAPGTFSHSLLVGSIAEAAAETIDCNGLLCRVGAYYHDIGKINKPGYFVENEIGSVSRHGELSPAMSQLIIVGHVKDGIEMAKEYSLPAVLRQFIETHHGTTLVEYFFSEAKKKKDGKQPTPSESEFRYVGPKPRTKEAAIVMLADTAEGAVRSMSGDLTPAKIETAVHNISMKRLQDGQFDECELSLRELSQIETSISKTLAAHHHGRIAYPKAPDEGEDIQSQPVQNGKKNNK
jgi:putative nucleotidyltransferase with HDIG domain